MRRSFVRFERVSVPYGLESRIVARIISGPYRYTPEEIEAKKETNEYHGFSTNRICKSYFILRYGTKNTMLCDVSAIKKLPSKRAMR